MQEALQKDVERAFGVLQACFAIVAQPARGWSSKSLNQLGMMDVLQRWSHHKTNWSISRSLSRTIKGYKMLQLIIN
jgi:hypothetical protein